MAHWLAASVFVARDALDRAEREVDSGLEVAAVESHEAAPFSVVALHWLKGLLCLARGAADEAMASFDRELALEARGHLYSRSSNQDRTGHRWSPRCEAWVEPMAIDRSWHARAAYGIGRTIVGLMPASLAPTSWRSHSSMTRST